MKKLIYTKFSKYTSRLTLAVVALFVAGSSSLPIFLGNASAVSGLTNRSLSMSSGVSAATGVKYTYTFTTQNASTIQSIKLIACDAAINTYNRQSSASTTGCTAPNLMNINLGSQSGTNTFTNTTAFTKAAGSGNCTSANNVLCLTRTQGASETAGAKSFVWDTQTNPTIPSGNGYSFYIGIYLYTDTGWTTPTADMSAGSGTTVAGAVVSSLLVQAQVAEILVFCVGSTSVDDATTAVGNASSCSGSTVDLGTLDPTSINFSKANGNNLNGVAIMRTNATNGSAVYYDAVQDTGTAHLGALRIQGSNCTTVPGSCINSVGTSQTKFTAGTQDFGMAVAGTNCGTETAAGYYSCVYSSGTEHLAPQAPYIGRTGNYCATNCNGASDNGFAWDESGASAKIAQASSSNVVADEALILKFAATPSITNTFGQYQVKVDFTAVPTF